MRYWKSCKFENEEVIYSCDMVRFSVVFREDSMKDLSRLYSNGSRLDVAVYPISLRDFKYRQLIVITIGESTVSIGVGFNGTNREDMFKGFIEFNPNKVLPEWLDELNIVLSYCTTVSIARMDVAIDIPIKRNLLTLRKDNRIYEYKMKSIEDKTEYLGRRNTPGRVKLYNKKIESELEYELTRLEITTEADIKAFISHCPIVYQGAEYNQLCFADLDQNGLNQTNIVMINMLNEFDLQRKKEFFQQLPKYMRKKIEPYVMPDKEFQIDLSSTKEIINKMNTYCK